MPNEITTAIERFLDLVRSEPGVEGDLAQLIELLDRLAWLAHGVEYEFDETEYPEPPTPDWKTTFARCEKWLQPLQQDSHPDELASLESIGDFSELVDDLAEIRWRFDNTSETGISPANVQGAPILEELQPRIVEAVTGARIFIYNASFDAGFLRTELKASAEIRCAMREFAEVYGKWSTVHGNWRWQRLRVAAAYVGFRWSGSSHRAIHDCAAIRAVWRYLTYRGRPNTPATSRHFGSRKTSLVKFPNCGAIRQGFSYRFYPVESAV